MVVEWVRASVGKYRGSVGLLDANGGTNFQETLLEGG